MPHPLRYLPCPSSLVEITQRTLQGRLLLRPSPVLNETLIGVLARAQRITGLRIHALAVLSNHFHLLASPATSQQISRFMGFVKTNLSKEIGRLHDWPGPMFDRRFTMIPVSDEEPAQVQRLRYLLSQSCKEGLVASPLDWPGVHSAKAQLGRQSMKGTWTDRTQRWAARQRKGKLDEAQYRTSEELHLDPLPCWADLPLAENKKRIRELIHNIESETHRHHRHGNTRPLGPRAILRQDPHQRTEAPTPRPRPRSHAYRKTVRAKMRGAESEFTRVYRAAAEKFQARRAPKGFPENCFPPSPPFIHPTPSHDSS